jgi:hypothetical protein
VWHDGSGYIYYGILVFVVLHAVFESLPAFNQNTINTNVLMLQAMHRLSKGLLCLEMRLDFLMAAADPIVSKDDVDTLVRNHFTWVGRADMVGTSDAKGIVINLAGVDPRDIDPVLEGSAYCLIQYPTEKKTEYSEVDRCDMDIPAKSGLFVFMEADSKLVHGRFLLFWRRIALITYLDTIFPKRMFSDIGAFRVEKQQHLDAEEQAYKAALDAKIRTADAMQFDLNTTYSSSDTHALDTFFHWFNLRYCAELDALNKIDHNTGLFKSDGSRYGYSLKCGKYAIIVTKQDGNSYVEKGYTLTLSNMSDNTVKSYYFSTADELRIQIEQCFAVMRK